MIATARLVKVTGTYAALDSQELGLVETCKVGLWDGKVNEIVDSMEQMKVEGSKVQSRH